MRANLRKPFAEALGTALLLAVVIGFGIMGERLSGGNLAVALLANTLATVAGLFVRIEVFGPLSGAHFIPFVSPAMVVRGHLLKSELGPYILAQLVGALLGACLAHAMFDLSALRFSSRVRNGAGRCLAECVATFGLDSSWPSLWKRSLRWGFVACWTGRRSRTQRRFPPSATLVALRLE